MSDAVRSGPDLGYALRRVTEAAAIAAYDWIGKGEKELADGAAVAAMRDVLKGVALDGVVVIGEGEKDDAPALYNGERVGQESAAFKADIAVDPVEGTTYLANGLPNALAVIAVSPRGTMLSPGPAFYMDKLAVPAAAKGKVDPYAPVADRLQALGLALGKDVKELSIYVLDKPRHEKLVADIRAAGAGVQLYTAGDVVGALLAALPGSGVDALMGTGGTPEGIMTAAAFQALGGDFFGRFNPQLPEEIEAVAQAGLDTGCWHGLNDLVRSEDVCFCASGITDGLLLDGVEAVEDGYRVQSLMLTGVSGERQIMTTHLPRS